MRFTLAELLDDANVTPAGSFPEASAHLRGAQPPPLRMTARYGFPTVALGKVVVTIDTACRNEDANTTRTREGNQGRMTLMLMRCQFSQQIGKVQELFGSEVLKPHACGSVHRSIPGLHSSNSARTVPSSRSLSIWKPSLWQIARISRFSARMVHSTCLSFSSRATATSRR